jgi:hypothetical protein
MQEVSGSIPLGSTNLSSLLPPRARYREAAKVARRSPKGEDGPVRGMRYVYLLQSFEHPERNYVGLADDLRSRLAAHNAGGSPHTAKYKPWRLVTLWPSRMKRKPWLSSDI